MVTKVEREKAAIAAAESDLAERRKKLALLEKEEAEKELAKLTKKVGIDRSIRLLQLAVDMKPKAAVEAMEKAASSTVAGS